MTKKQYIKKMRQVQRNIAKFAKETGEKPFKADRISTPKWGTVITVGKHEGEILRSYQQAWDMLYEVLGGTIFMNGIK